MSDYESLYVLSSIAGGKVSDKTLIWEYSRMSFRIISLLCPFNSKVEFDFPHVHVLYDLKYLTS